MSCGPKNTKGGSKGGKKSTAGSHVMPDGTVMKNSAHKKGKGKKKT